MPAFSFLVLAFFLFGKFPFIQLCCIYIPKLVPELHIYSRKRLDVLFVLPHILPFLPCLEFRLANFPASSPRANSAENSDSCVFRCGVFEYFSTAFLSALRFAIFITTPVPLFSAAACQLCMIRLSCFFIKRLLINL